VVVVVVVVVVGGWGGGGGGLIFELAEVILNEILSPADVP
jgi:hypothetical protein